MYRKSRRTDGLSGAGVKPGAISPLAAIHDGPRRVRIVLDRELLRRTLLKFHPLVSNRTTALSPEGLLRFLAATGHTPFIVDL
jgi:Ala-tRNA(Pro) deacylase